MKSSGVEPPANILLVADDFAISEGVTEGIEQLARAHRISATSAIVTLPRWKHDGARLAALRCDIAIGLHVNLTVGEPIGALPSLAPDGKFPTLGTLIAKATTGRTKPDEVHKEILLQLRRFEEFAGYPPDFIDGHQHVHALRGIRDAFVGAIAEHFAGQHPLPLVRIPHDNPAGLLRRARARSKALLLAGLSAGFRRAVLRAGFACNDTFAGVTTFGATQADVTRDLEAAATGGGPIHLVMCHPGVPSDELARLDPLLARRSAELCVLASDNALTSGMLHPSRRDPRSPIDWKAWPDATSQSARRA